MRLIGQIWTSLWLVYDFSRKHLLESMSLYGKFKIKNFWASNVTVDSNRCFLEKS